MKFIVLAVLVAVVLATGAITSNRIHLQKGSKNRLNFACGAIDRKTGRNGVYRDAISTYSYTFKGHPSWLTVKGSYLTGICPSNDAGEYPITVTYRSKDGKKTGEKVYTLSTKPVVATPIVAGTATSRATFFRGFFDKNNRLTASRSASFVVLCPVLPATQVPITAPVVTDAVAAPATTTTSTTTTTDTTTATIDTSSIPAVDTSASSTATSASGTTADTTGTTSTDTTLTTDTTAVDATTSVDPATATLPVDTATTTPADITPADATVTTVDTSSTIAPASTTATPTATTPTTSTTSTQKDTDDSCNSSAAASTTAGTGIVTAISTDSVTIDNKIQIKFGKCSRKGFYAGRKNFQLKDKVSYQVVKGTSTHWAKSIICK